MLYVALIDVLESDIKENDLYFKQFNSESTTTTVAAVAAGQRKDVLKAGKDGVDVEIEYLKHQLAIKTKELETVIK